MEAIVLLLHTHHHTTLSENSLISLVAVPDDDDLQKEVKVPVAGVGAGRGLSDLYMIAKGEETN